MVGRLDGALSGAPVSIEATGRSLLIRSPLRLGIVRSLRGSRAAARPIVDVLNTAGIRVQVKLGLLPRINA